MRRSLLRVNVERQRHPQVGEALKQTPLQYITRIAVGKIPADEDLSGSSARAEVEQKRSMRI